MCYNAILPVTINSDNLNDSLVKLTYTFNRWLKMLIKYGKLDSDTLSDDFITISKVLRSKSIDRSLKTVIKSCRDYVLTAVNPMTKLQNMLNSALNLISNTLEDKEIMKVKAFYDDRGMTERYKYLSKRLAREKVRRINREIIYTDACSDDSATTRLVRRIVEKRAAQAVYKSFGKRRGETTSYRQSIRRAVSFSLYNASFTDYDAKKRASGTHWRVDFCHRGKLKRLKAKRSYNTREEATEAYNKYLLLHPEDLRPISVYRCGHCGKWHIGHTYVSLDSVELDAPEMNKAS